MAWFDFVCAADTHGEIIDADYSKYILKFVEDVKPKKRFHLGDVFDLKPLRAGAHAEDRASSLKDDISAGLRFLRAFKPHVLTWGNHDHRLKVMASSMREGLEFDYARQLKAQIDNEIKAMRCKATTYDVEKNWHEFAPGRLIGHGFASSLYVAKVNCVHFGSTITGHVHAFDYHKMDNLAGAESYVSGCGCKIAQDYNRTHRRRLKHEVGFLYGAANDKTGDWQVWQVKRTKDKKWLNPILQKK